MQKAKTLNADCLIPYLILSVLFAVDLSIYDFGAAAVFTLFCDDNFVVNSFTERLDMRDYTYKTVALRKGNKSTQSPIKCLAVKRTEALVNKHCIKLYQGIMITQHMIFVKIFLIRIYAKGM